MNDLTFTAVLLFTAIGAFCAGYVWGYRNVIYWRIKWIELENDSARKEGSEPRNIDSANTN